MRSLHIQLAVQDGGMLVLDIGLITTRIMRARLNPWGSLIRLFLFWILVGLILHLWRRDINDWDRYLNSIFAELSMVNG